jgi:YVTN family beta-propeller protein
MQSNARVRSPRSRLAAVLALIATSAMASAQSFVNWENPPLHAVDLSPDLSTLAAVNLPDNRVELFDLSTGTPVSVGAVQVGLDPVSVRFRTDGELWVVNHISDSVSVVDVLTARVVATLQTQDEPYDVVFAGSPERALVSCSQANAVLVFDTATRALVNTIAMNIEEPRALAVSPDGTSVYVAVFRSSNATTLISGGDRRNLIPNVAGGNAAGPLTGVQPFTGGPYGGTNPPPNTGGPTTEPPTLASFVPPIKPEFLPGGANPAPPVGLIVRKNAAGLWLDDNGGDWTQFITGSEANETLRVVGWDMPDRDVAVIDVPTLTVTGYARGLMNAVMALAVNPGSGEVTAVGTDGTNEVRFEPNLTGTFLRVNMGIVDPANPGSPSVVDLNAGHLDYSTGSVTQNERDQSLGDPRGIVWNASGTRGYVTGMGSNNLIVVDAGGGRLGRVELGQGPVGLACDDTRQQLYVLDRFAATISVVSTVVPEAVVATVPLFDPTPAAVKLGRRHLYDTHATSGLGQVACGSCHIDGREDALSWDLGDPGGDMQAVLGTDVTAPANTPNPGPNAHNLYATGFLSGYEDWHPMKGPMTTQTLQDIIGLEPFHHRGDKDGLEGFAAAFVKLQGDDAPLPPIEMQEFEDFLATISYPPNPFRAFDNSLPTNLPLPGVVSTGRYALAEGQPLPNGNAQNGFALFTTSAPGATRCVQCHSLPTAMTTHKRWDGSEFVTIPKGPQGESHLALRPDDTTIHRGNKAQSWRNLYEKAGTDFTQPESKTGFGYMNDGREDTIVRRAMATIFNFGSDQAVADFVALVLSYSGFGEDVNPNPTSTSNPPGPRSQDTHAAVGRQVTISDSAAVPLFGQPDAIAKMVSMARENPGRTDLVVKGLVGGVQKGWFYDRILRKFLSDIDGDTASPGALRNMASPTSELTYTVVPRGSGLRVGIDRDEDGFGDLTEDLDGGDPADPLVAPDNLLFEVSLNQNSLMPGETIELTLTVAPGTAPPTVDAYILLERPGGGLLFLQPNGTLPALPRAFFSNWSPVALDTVVFSATLPGNLPSGIYVWHTRLFVPGTLNLDAAVSTASFEFNLD